MNNNENFIDVTIWILDNKNDEYFLTNVDEATLLLKYVNLLRNSNSSLQVYDTSKNEIPLILKEVRCFFVTDNNKSSMKIWLDYKKSNK